MNNVGHGSLKAYITGFVVSLLLTLVPYWLVVHRDISGLALGATLIGFAAAQLLVQALFFLHLRQETKPRWKGIAFLFMLMVVVIVVLGSIWVMQNLDYNMMAPHETNHHIEEKERTSR